MKFRWVLLTTVALLATLMTAPPAAAEANDPIINPIPEKPITSDLGLTVEKFASFPKSEPVPTPTDPRLDRWARINYIGEVPDKSGRMYVPDLNGRMYLVENGRPHVYLDVGATFAPDFFSGAGIGQGFGFVAFHPDFAGNGKFYTVHTESGDALKSKTPNLPQQAQTTSHGIITEWTADDPSAGTFHGTRREMLRIGFAGQAHGIQQIGFNPNAKRGDEDYGLLYIAAGDGGNSTTTGNDDPQNLARPHGKILRIDPLGRNAATGTYGIPSANPFVDRPGALGEIYAYGMRDPHRFSWDSSAGHRMFLGHIGEHAIESVYDVQAGDNFGWSEREGSFVFNKQDRCHLYPLPADDEKYGYTYPVAAYSHNPPPNWSCTKDSGHAISGGYVYRGRTVPELYGKYVFGDIVDGRVFYTNEREMRRGEERAPIHQLMVFDKTGKRVTMAELTGDTRVDLRFGTDAQGELYLIAKANGTIWKVTGTRHFAGCDVGGTQMTEVTQDWTPVTPSKWQFEGNKAIMTEPGKERPGPRRPFEYAVLTAGPEFSSFELEADVRIDVPTTVKGRDVLVVFGHRSDTQFSYAHLSQDNTVYAHNGIFAVDNADRARLEDQWDPVHSRGATPAISDNAWHHVRVVRCADSGETAVYLDRSKSPLMTAVDTRFTSGRVGFGSFDDKGRMRNLKVTGTPTVG
ncbi:PQQ-dependent sugar dehydrogenase [Streptomyces sp. NPDC056291]|uniref:PQQ-dependent sugar dehydrogenase n=1 Tax=unclassified Streptomyces TaxID=2593676 RepID=UPI0035D6AF48